MDQLSLVQVQGEDVPKRNKSGAVPSKFVKAVGWYAQIHELKISASNAYPIYVFHDESGLEHSVSINDILDEYKQRDKQGSN